MESVDTTISNHLQPFFDEMIPVMNNRNYMDQACILEQIVSYFEMSFPRHARRTALTTHIENMNAIAKPANDKMET